MRLLTTSDRIAARFLPTGAVLVHGDAAGTCVYHFTDSSGRPCAMGFRGTASRAAFRFYYGGEGRRQEATGQWFLNASARAEASAARRAAVNAERAAFVTALAAGDVVYTSWGYDQTNVDFYQVVRVVGKHTVEVVHLKQATTETGFMCGTTEPVQPLEAAKDAKPFRAKVSLGDAVGIGRQRAHKWDGRAKGCSWYG